MRFSWFSELWGLFKIPLWLPLVFFLGTNCVSLLSSHSFTISSSKCTIEVFFRGVILQFVIYQLYLYQFPGSLSVLSRTDDKIPQNFSANHLSQWLSRFRSVHEPKLPCPQASPPFIYVGIQIIFPAAHVLFTNTANRSGWDYSQCYGAHRRSHGNVFGGRNRII